MPPRRKNSITLDPVTKTFAEVDPPSRPVKVELTKEDKERVIKDFVEVMKREPTEEEVETLLTEEKKIKQGRR